MLNLTLMRLIDEQFLETPWYGSRQMARHLRREGYTVGRKRGASVDGQDGAGADLPASAHNSSTSWATRLTRIRCARW
jgi:putative transposase